MDPSQSIELSTRSRSSDPWGCWHSERRNSLDIPDAPEVFPRLSLVSSCISSGCVMGTAVIVERLVVSMLMDGEHAASRAAAVVLAKTWLKCCRTRCIVASGPPDTEMR